ncbi:MAG TPA: hypothetical protein VHG32_07705 [Thermoanaerobaculia bacterium]|jgi:formylglycine-generating enzyme required for sulfatase activity|nr:hypothetical protein [Thermoanaerobaculia bacterium]
MPRKNRCTALALVFALVVCLAGQAAAALPLASPRAAASDSTAGDFIGAVWAWLSSHWEGLGNAVAARPAATAVEKSAGGSDPNGGSHSARHSVIRGMQL